MIMRFAELIYQEDPTFITGFNESSFDWPFIKQKLELHSDPEYYASPAKPPREPKNKYVAQFTGKLQGMVFDAQGRAYSNTGYKYATRQTAIFKSSDVKVTAGNTRKGICIDVPGIICIDTRTLLMKD
jgi:DNA polymerase elongation subunit (family B)